MNWDYRENWWFNEDIDANAYEVESGQSGHDELEIHQSYEGAEIIKKLVG